MINQSAIKANNVGAIKTKILLLSEEYCVILSINNLKYKAFIIDINSTRSNPHKLDFKKRVINFYKFNLIALIILMIVSSVILLEKRQHIYIPKKSN